MVWLSTIYILPNNFEMFFYMLNIFMKHTTYNYGGNFFESCFIYVRCVYCMKFPILFS